MTDFRPSLAVPALLALTGCTAVTLPDLSSVTNFMAPTQPAMRWDHRDEASEWTASTLAAIAAHDDTLAAKTPGDIEDWCPGYDTASMGERRAFWSGLLSAVAKYESSWNPAAAGGGGRYVGLMQISPKTAANYDCDATSSAALKDGAANLSCAVEIIAAQVGRDGMVSGNGNRGVGRDWGPMKSASKRSEMAEWTSAQTYCQ